MLKADSFSAFKGKVETIIKDRMVIDQFAYETIITAIHENFSFQGIDSYLDFFKELIWLAIKINTSVFYLECHRRIGNIFSVNEVNIEFIQASLKEFIVQENIKYEVQYFLYLILIEIKSNRLIGKKAYIALKDASEISKENFKTHIDTFPGINDETINLFYCSLNKMNEDNKSIIDKEIVEIMISKVKEYPDDFIKYIAVLDSLIPHQSDPEIYDYRFVPFLIGIFKDLNGLLNFLRNTNFKTESDRAKVYLKYAENVGFENGNLSITYPFLPERSDYVNFFSELNTFKGFLDWKAKSSVD